MNYSADTERWIWKYMPVIVQCDADINAGYGLIAVFYHYNIQKQVMEFHYVFKVIKDKVYCNV